jgi:hypothetical protein
MSSLSKETLELIAGWAEILTVTLALASAACGVVLVYANKPLKVIADRESADAKAALLEQQLRADEAAGKLAGLEEKAAKQQERAAKAELQLETERKERVGLEEAVANRVILDQNDSGNRLKAFTGIKVAIVSRANPEQWKLAGQLSTVAYLANWPVLAMHKFASPDPKVPIKVFDKPMEIPIFTREGVDIGASNPNDLVVAKALQAELAKSKIKAHVSRPVEDVPPGTLLITIGENPTDYFDRNKKGTRGNTMYTNVIEHP